MNNRTNLIQFQIFSAIFVIILGILLHFTYTWSKNNSFVGLFSAINESTWEHLKLLFFPMLIFALIQIHFFKDFSNFWCIKLIGILAGLILIPILFYTITGIFGKTPDFINIAIFFIAAATAFIIETYLFKNYHCCKSPYIAFLIICFIGFLFIIFTFLTPHIPLFQDPVTNSYGIKK
jgi:hypothetical protein